MQQTTTNGSTVSFTCSGDGGPGNSFQWMRERDLTTLMDSDENVDISSNSTHSVLTISNVNATQHGGGYRCVASNAAGNDSDIGTLYVSPVITVQPVETLLTSDGSTEQLVCVADSFPSPEYRWEKLNANANVFEAISGGNSGVLEFSTVQFSDYGVYRCVATAPEINISAESKNSTVTGECIDLVAIS